MSNESGKRPRRGGVPAQPTALGWTQLVAVRYKPRSVMSLGDEGEELVDYLYLKLLDARVTAR